MKSTKTTKFGKIELVLYTMISALTVVLLGFHYTGKSYYALKYRNTNDKLDWLQYEIYSKNKIITKNGFILCKQNVEQYTKDLNFCLLRFCYDFL